MLEQLADIDQNLFFLINREWASPLLDAVLPWMRNKYFWIPVYFFISSFLIINFRKRGWAIIVFAVITIMISDQVSSSVIKPAVNRERPCNDEFISEYVMLRISSCGSGKSFPSSHAANHFALAFFLGIVLFRKFRWVLPVGILWAAVISYSQVYVGVHYPLDVAGGAGLGVLSGLFAGVICKKFLGEEF